MMLFKEILDQQPTRGPSTFNAKKKSKGPSKACERSTKGMQRRKVATKNLQTKPRCLNTFSSDSSQVESRKKKPIEKKTTKFDVDIPSSTPLITPIKKDHPIPTEKLHQPPISSSQCSLIELLQQFNQSAFLKVPKSGSDNESTTRTLTPEPVKDHSNPNVQTFQEVLVKLLGIIQLSGTQDKSSVKRAFEEVLIAYRLLNGDDTSMESNLFNQTPVKLEELQMENLSLQRKLRLAENELRKSKSKASSNDISFELVTLQCRNGVLEQKVTELTGALEQSLALEQSTQNINEQLTSQNTRLEHDLMMKNDELTMSGNLFSSETQEIKKDVSEALQKVEVLKSNLTEASQENLLLSQEIRSKDFEIQRLNELNKGLQSSVSRLLDDLKKNCKPSSGEGNVATVVLKKFGDILSSPPAPKSPTKQLNLDLHKPSAPHVLPSTASSTQFFLPRHGYQHGYPETIINSATAGSISSAPIPTPDSVSSSMWSVTSRDEKDFHVGLALLDADILRLQENLRRLNTSDRRVNQNGRSEGA